MSDGELLAVLVAAVLIAVRVLVYVASLESAEELFWTRR